MDDLEMFLRDLEDDLADGVKSGFDVTYAGQRYAVPNAAEKVIRALEQIKDARRRRLIR